MQLQFITLLLMMLTCLARSCSLHKRDHEIFSHLPGESVNSSLAAQPGHELLRRWYGVKQSIDINGVNQKLEYPYYYPWPAYCNSPNFQPVRYCWKDLRSQTNLQNVIDGVVTAWSQATLRSSLDIILEPTCNGNKKCLCSDTGVKKDALMISDETRDGDEAWNLGPDCYTASTVGYRYIPAGQPDVPYRHYMKLCSYAPQYSWGTLEYAIRDGKHETGHVVGLQHEHQREDRNGAIWFKCKNLKGYDDAYVAADLDVDDFFADDELSMKEKMFRVCNHQLYAEKFLPAALEYIRMDADHMDSPDSIAIAGSMVKSDQFDYESIMIYDGNLMSKDPKKYVLTKRGPNGELGGPVWMGGGVDGDPKKTQISAGDIARISQLYPKWPKTDDDAPPDPAWGPIRVIIGDRVNTIVPAPRKRDEL